MHAGHPASLEEHTMARSRLAKQLRANEGERMSHSYAFEPIRQEFSAIVSSGRLAIPTWQLAGRAKGWISS